MSELKSVSQDFGLTAPFRTREGSRVTAERDRAEEQAWSSLARYKFWMFGYHAAQWVLLNRVADKKDRRSNPFKSLVQAARQRDRLAPLVETPRESVGFHMENEEPGDVRIVCHHCDNRTPAPADECMHCEAPFDQGLRHGDGE